jgi:GNAT superfamily N-acetyltransferase
MLQIREAYFADAEAIAALLIELGYPASVAELPGRLAAVAAAPGQVRVGRALVEAAARQGAAWGCATLDLASRDDRQGAHRFYRGLGFESRSRKFARPVPG